jgi:hypothetical protein
MMRDKNGERCLSLSQEKYAGQYVVIAGGEFVGAGRDLPTLVKRARNEHPKETPLSPGSANPAKCTCTPPAGRSRHVSLDYERVLTPIGFVGCPSPR